MFEIKPNIHWIGVNDRRTSLFENYWPIPHGVAYNSYLIVDEKIAIIDTVESSKMDDYIDNLLFALNGRKVDYLIINHMEPDHSGAIKTLLSYFPNIMIVGNAKTFPMLKNFYGIDNNLFEVKEGDELSLGKHNLKFHMIPMVHWPETMVSYESTENILFSGDAFGAFGSHDGGIFDDQIDLDYREEEIMRYYTNIVGKYGQPVQTALKKLGSLPIKMICATHGPIWRSHIAEIIAKYDKWSKYESDEGVVIAFSSMYGNTENIADYIGWLFAQKGIKKIRIHDTSKTHPSYIINDIFRYKGVVMGSCAYNSGIFPTMETLLSELENMGVKNHYVGFFANKVWSGGAVKRFQEFAVKIKWEVVTPIEESWCCARNENFEAYKNLVNTMVEKIRQ